MRVVALPFGVRPQEHPLAVPCPYNRGDLRGLRTTLDSRWPELPDEDAARWLRRVKEQRPPYAQVRVHATSRLKNLPSPEVIAAEIVEDLQAALDEFSAIASTFGSSQPAS